MTPWTILDWRGAWGGEEHFTPAVADVLALEAALPAALAAVGPSLVPMRRRPDPFWERLPDYRRQYFGIARGDWLLIMGNIVHVGFCPGDSWRTDLVAVDDGGYGVLTVTYDLASGTIIEVLSNGYA